MIVVLGESENDRVAIAELVRALCPSAKVVTLRRPMVLIKNTRQRAIPTQAERVAEAVKAVAHHDDIRCVFAHEDADTTEPHHEKIAEKIEGALIKAGTPGAVHAVVPAWEIEAWWFMWPDLVGGCYQRWKPPVVSTPPGRIADAKERLARAVRPSGMSPKERKRFPDYRESDSIKIARKIREEDSADSPTDGRSRSYDRFRDSVATCCHRAA